jgi:hypothetical protein
MKSERVKVYDSLSIKNNKKGMKYNRTKLRPNGKNTGRKSNFAAENKSET